MNKKPLWAWEIEATFLSFKVHGFKKTIKDIIFDIKNGTWSN